MEARLENENHQLLLELDNITRKLQAQYIYSQLTEL